MKENWMYKMFGWNVEPSFPTDPKVIKSILGKLGVNDYTLKSDGSVDVSTGVNLNNLTSKTIPLKFGTIGGDFIIQNCKFQNLLGLPNRIDGDLVIKNNPNLYSTDGIGNLVLGGEFSIDQQTPISKIFNLFGDFRNFQRSLFYNYIVKKGSEWMIHLKPFEDALYEFGITPPESVEGYKYTYSKK